MDGYGPASYGDAFADVYDEWYQSIGDVGATVELVTAAAERAGDHHVLELGVGTGRLAVPFADAGLDVVGVDASTAMLERLAARDPENRVERICGDMVDDLPAGPFGVVVVAYNTLFNVECAARQQQLFDAVAVRLAPLGSFIVEAFVPDVTRVGSHVEVRSMTADRVVLSASIHDPDEQRAQGQFIEISEADGVRLRPWSIRYAPPSELDAMAGDAGLVVRDRFEDVLRTPFSIDSDRHVTVYSRA